MKKGSATYVPLLLRAILDYHCSFGTVLSKKRKNFNIAGLITIPEPVATHPVTNPVLISSHPRKVFVRLMLNLLEHRCM